jgi:hypothetical protein
MSRLTLKFKRVLHPQPDSSAWLDILMLVIFGPWFLVGVFALLFSGPQTVEQACSGPGFADFGCMGGWEATIVTIINTVLMVTLAATITVSTMRLVNRRQEHYRG